MLVERTRREKAANIKPDPDIDIYMKASVTKGQEANVVTDYVLKGTAVISLLQPAPETYNLLDDIILLSDGYIVYQGPREAVFDFFESMGFKCPKRKGVADFLQEVTSKNYQQQYWAKKDEPYRLVPSKEFSEAYKSFHTVIEIPYVFVQAAVYGIIVYAMIGFEWTASKFFWYFFIMYFTLLYFTFYGMMTVAVTLNQNVASIRPSSMQYGISSQDLSFHGLKDKRVHLRRTYEKEEDTELLCTVHYLKIVFL
ncbi:hypothetical protein K7X08_030531 [Anisodus acutangulus]|uniref:Uncharacterized protein n=1 Tax=Anisodus acutangulus TaxID=402998 RepID=A0A9Q1MQT5_9SOLA|nr:hypothetical protein K7X08_030531 [Anisodus acutangulus]